MELLRLVSWFDPRHELCTVFTNHTNVYFFRCFSLQSLSSFSSVIALKKLLKMYDIV